MALGASLAADGVLVLAGTSLFPSTRGYGHFRFSDYGLLTTIGVVGACAAWPCVVRLSWAPRWQLLRLAIVVTIVLWLPDVWILARGEPPRAVLVLAVMHLAVAVVSYNALVRIAPAQPGTVCGRGRLELVAARRAPWVALASLVGFELLLGVVVLLLVPLGRGDGWVPRQAGAPYLLHALLGGLLGVASIALAVAARHSPRLERACAWTGLAGVALAALGGALAAFHALRLLGAALMMLGALVACCAYLVPLFEPATAAPPPAATGAGSLEAGAAAEPATPGEPRASAGTAAAGEPAGGAARGTTGYDQPSGRR
ncbi:MAG TPA: hypothetical protein VMD59_09810 [Acidimicrobiales bacterium]|nr:hypothetical protein [Acidimicrobiales bacterium]